MNRKAMLKVAIMLMQAPKACKITAILMAVLNDNLLYSITVITAPTIYRTGYILLIIVQLVSLTSYILFNNLRKPLSDVLRTALENIVNAYKNII